MRIQRFEDVIARQKGRSLFIELHGIFVNQRDFTFKDQVLRAALSITNNIAEGFDRGTDKEFRYFLYISTGSCAEVRSMLLVAKDLAYISELQQKKLVTETEEISRLLTGFIKKLSPGKAEDQ